MEAYCVYVRVACKIMHEQKYRLIFVKYCIYSTFKHFHYHVLAGIISMNVS